MGHYQKHWFICTNERSNGKASCGNAGNLAICKHLKQKIKDLGLSGPHHWRVSPSGCMGRCQEGPLLVVYPEGHWYRCPSIAAADAILAHERSGEALPPAYVLDDNAPSEDA